MNIRKFYFITTIIVTVFLFIAGIAVIQYLNGKEKADTTAVNSDNNIDDLFKPFIKSKDPFNVLILGRDKASGNSDTMMLLNFDPDTCEINVMSIPRDTRVKIKKSFHKINFAYLSGGVKLSARTVSELLDVNIKYYVFVDTTAFIKIIDILGGVKINVPTDLDYDDPTQDLHIHLKKGLQVLDGDKSQQFIRFREPNRWTKEIKKYYDGSDLKRIEYQQYFIKELIKQKLNIQYITRINSIIDIIFENIETNFTLNEIVKLSSLLGKINSENVTFIPMPGTPQNGSPWYYLCDVDKTRKITAAEFECSESFIEVMDEAKKEYTKKDFNNTDDAKASPKSTKPEKSVTKDNPSNSDSSLNGQQTPAP